MQATSPTKYKRNDKRSEICNEDGKNCLTICYFKYECRSITSRHKKLIFSSFSLS